MCLDHPQSVLREVERPFAGCLRGQVRGHLAGANPAGVGARRVQERPAGAVDRADDRRGQRLEPLGRRLGVGGVMVQERRPAATETDDLVAVVRDPVHDGLDARIEPGHVPAAGQDPDPHPLRSYQAAGFAAMPKVGLEPTRPRGQRILSPPRGAGEPMVPPRAPSFPARQGWAGCGLPAGRAGLRPRLLVHGECAEGGTRTHTPSRATDFESAARRGGTSWFPHEPPPSGLRPGSEVL